MAAGGCDGDWGDWRKNVRMRWNMWNDIANISAIATLILFVFYFLGRLWCIRVEKKDLYEKIVVRGVDSKDYDLDIEYVNGDEII